MPSSKNVQIYLVWTVVCVLSLAGIPPMLDATHPGGMALGMTALAYMLPISIIGYGVISFVLLAIHVLYGPKKREYILFNGLILAAVIGLYVSYLLSMLNDIDTVMHERREGRDEIHVERDYYRYGRSLKAIRYTRNLYPDSIWVEYDRFGNIIKREVYKRVK